MKSKKTIAVLILAAAGFSLVYILCAARPLSKEYQFTPEWKISVSVPSVTEPEPGKKQLYFKLGQSLGYFSDDGKVSLYRSFPSKASVSGSYFALYTPEAQETPFFNPRGEKCGVISQAGFPYFDEDRIFVMLPGGSSFAKCAQDGSSRWTYYGTVPVTAFASNRNCTAAGFADGTIKVFENTGGETEIDFAPGGSDYPVILGLDISPDGEYVASVSGHERQRFVLAKKEPGQPKIVFHEFLDKDIQYRTLVYFCSDGKRVLYNYLDTLGIYDLDSGRSYKIPLSSRIISVEETGSLVFLLGRNGSTYTVYILEKTNRVEGSFSFEADSAFIRTDGDTLFIGKDTSVSKISVTRE